MSSNDNSCCVKFCWHNDFIDTTGWLVGCVCLSRVWAWRPTFSSDCCSSVHCFSHSTPTSVEMTSGKTTDSESLQWRQRPMLVHSRWVACCTLNTRSIQHTAYSVQHTAYRPVEAVTSVGSVSQRNDRFTVYHFVKRWRVVNIQMKFCNFKFVVVFDVTFLVTWYNACISVTYWSCCNCRVDDDGRWLKLVNWVKYNAKVCYRHWW